jgi:hypothetical protein
VVAPTSIGGFAVIEPGSALLKTGVVPGTNVRLTMRRDVLPLFLALARAYHDTVAPLRYGECGAYNYRAAMGGGGWSDHAAGVAVDLNWGHEGASGLLGGMATMSPAQVKACAALKQRFRVVIWGGDKARGGDYVKPSNWDPMHFALRPGVTSADVAAVLRDLRIQPDGTIRASDWTRVTRFPSTGVYDSKSEHGIRVGTKRFLGNVEYVAVERDSLGRNWLRTPAGNFVLAAATAYKP